MNKWMYQVAIATPLALGSLGAMAADTGGFFINGEVAGSNYDVSNLQNNTSTAGAVRLGYLWNAGQVDWGVEGGYVDLGKATGNSYFFIDNAAFPQNVSVKTRGALLGGNVKMYFGDGNWFLSARGGWFHSSTRARFSTGSYSVSDSEDGNGIYAGVGVGYDFTPHAGVALNYDNYQSSAPGIYDRRFNIGMYGATFEYRF